MKVNNSDYNTIRHTSELPPAYRFVQTCRDDPGLGVSFTTLFRRLSHPKLDIGDIVCVRINFAE